MANYATLKAAIQAVIKQNGNNEITGDLLQQALLSMINSLGAGYQFIGVAIPSTNPGTPDQNCFYLASRPGEYSNFGFSVTSLCVLYYNGTWHKKDLGQGYKVGRIYFDSGEHSSLLDEIVFSGKKGQDIIIKVSGTVIPNSVYFRKNGVDVYEYTLGSAGAKKISPSNDFDRVGFYKEPGNAGYVDYEMFIIQENAIVPLIIPYATQRPNIDTVNNVLDLQNCIIVFGGAYYEMPLIWPNNPEKYRQIPLKGGIESSATKIVFDYDTKELFPVEYSTRLTQTQILIGAVRTDYGVNGSFIDANFTFEYTVDGVARGKNLYPQIIPNAAGRPNIDTVNKVLNLRDCIILYGGKSFEMSQIWPNNPEKYTQIPLRGNIDSSATKIVFNLSTKELYPIIWSDVIKENEVIIGVVRTDYSSKEFVDANFLFEYTIDGKEPWERQQDGYIYYGEIFPPRVFNRRTAATMSGGRWHQSVAIYENIGAFFNCGVDINGDADETACVLSLYNLASGALIVRLNVPYGSLTVPHCNTAVFGTEFYSENSVAPMLYLSQWNGERNCLVYDIKEVGGEYSIDLVQTISTDNISGDIEGVGMRDWVVDNENNKLYSIAYKINSDYTAAGNATMIMCFDLPSKENANVVLTQADIVDNFELEFIRYFQDKFFKFGRLFISAGMYNFQSDTKIVAIDVEKKQIVTRIPLGNYWNAEPEGLDCYNNKMVYSYGGSVLYEITNG